jgi:hypothetical protein
VDIFFVHGLTGDAFNTRLEDKFGISDLLGAGSIWSSNVDSASMWIWIGPSGWWIGVDLRMI